MMDDHQINIVAEYWPIIAVVLLVSAASIVALLRGVITLPAGGGIPNIITDNLGWIGSATVILGLLFIGWVSDWDNAGMLFAIGGLVYGGYRWQQEDPLPAWIPLTFCGLMLALVTTGWGERQVKWAGGVVGVRTDAEVAAAQELLEAQEAAAAAEHAAQLVRVGEYRDGRRVISGGNVVDMSDRAVDVKLLTFLESGSFTIENGSSFCPRWPSGHLRIVSSTEDNSMVVVEITQPGPSYLVLRNNCP